jgi:hypothetical protein
MEPAGSRNARPMINSAQSADLLFRACHHCAITPYFAALLTGYRQKSSGRYFMKRLLIVPFLLLGSTATFAQGSNAGLNQSACARDVSRYCRATMNDGDMAVLGCLKEHRAKLGKACAKVLVDNGQ